MTAALALPRCPSASGEGKAPAWHGQSRPSATCSSCQTLIGQASLRPPVTFHCAAQPAPAHSHTPWSAQAPGGQTSPLPDTWLSNGTPSPWTPGSAMGPPPPGHLAQQWDPLPRTPGSAMGPPPPDTWLSNATKAQCWPPAPGRLRRK